MEKTNNNVSTKHNVFVLFATRLVLIVLFIATLLTLAIWLSNKSTQPYLNLLSFTWINLLIWLISSILTVILVQKFVRREPILDKDFKKTTAQNLPVVVLIKVLANLTASIAMILPAIAVLGFFILSNTYFRYSILSSAQTWLNGYAWFFIVTLLVLSSGLLIGTLATRFSGKRKLLNILTSSALVIILCSLLYIPVYHQNKQLEDAASGITNAIESQRVATASSLNFNVYQPYYLPQGYTLATDSDYGPSINSAVSSPPDENPESFQFVYFNNNNPIDEIFIYSYAAPSNYNPPTDCGNDARGYSNGDTNQCALIGQSTLGCNVYYVSNISPRQTYCQLGNTVVGSYLYNNLVPGASITSKAQYNQILSIYNSLQKLTVAQAQQLINQTND